MKAGLAEAFHSWLRDEGIRVTGTRTAVAEHLARRGGHPSLAELTAELRPRVSKVTVYRTVRMLEDAGLVTRLTVEGVDRYEPAGEHHDHLVCLGCGRVEEFHSDAIELRQQALARALGFEATGHVHVLYGRCAGCRGGSVQARPSASRS